MKIGVITFSDFNTNYGSMLQTLALKDYLESLGHNVTEIKYREFNEPEKESVTKSRKMIAAGKKTYYFFLKRIKRKDILQTRRNFEEFKKNELQYTPLGTNDQEIMQYCQDMDAFICGSDQIWNLGCLGGLRTPYFLSFAPEGKIKIAYSASMGDYHFNDEEKQTLSVLLNRFDAISLREKENVNEVQKITNVKVNHTVDPVFLLSADEWKKKLPACPIKGDYGVCYFVRRSKFGMRSVYEVKRKYRIPIYNLSDNSIYFPSVNSKYISADPLMFLSILSNAKFAIGTSFHLAAFSILFNVPLISIGLPSNKSRIANILELAGISSNYVSSSAELSELTAKPLTAPKTGGALTELIAFSKNYLSKALNRS